MSVLSVTVASFIWAQCGCTVCHGILGQTLVFVSNRALREGFSFCFSVYFY